MLWHDLAVALDKIEKLPGRLDMTEALAQVWRELKPEEIEPASYLLQGQLAPSYDTTEFQLSTKMLLRALATLWPAPVTQGLFGESDTSTALNEVTALYKELGDVGLVASKVISARTAAPATHLDIPSLFELLREVALTVGQGSQERKQQQLVSLLSQLDPIEAKYVVRIIMGKLRLGFSEQTMLDSLSWSMTGDKSEREWLEAAYTKKVDIGALAHDYLQWRDDEPAERQRKLAEVSVVVGIPVLPALCQRLNSAQEIIDKMGTVIAEPKYDGMRVQVHFRRQSDGSAELKVFTRNLEEVSHMFPELAEWLLVLDCQSCILDGEAIGYDVVSGELLPFQATITRKRKHDIEATSAAVPLRYYFFDILSLNEVDVTSEKLQNRKGLLEKIIKKNEHLLSTNYIVTSDPNELRIFHEQQLAVGLEGAVIKQHTSAYQSGRKGWTWVKIKEAEGTTGKLADTLDCVVLGYYKGRGKRAGFGLGAFLVGVVAEGAAGAEPTIKTIAKIGTGISDEQLVELRERCDAIQVSEMPTLYEVPTALQPDVWVRPELVVEIAADELTRSPLHTAGVALRFPRLIKWRDDKKWSDATTVAELEQF